jgi:hypothetical protein
MFRKIALLLALVSTVAFAQLSSIDKQELLDTNTIVNGGYENGFQFWAKTGGGTVAITTTSSDVGFGRAALAYDAAAASDAVTGRQVTVPSGLRGETCKLLVHLKGGDANLTVEAIDSTPAVLASVPVATTANYATYFVQFTCPTSGTIAPRIIASGDAAAVYADGWFLGLADATGSLTNPMDSPGDLITGGVSGAATKLDSGTSGQLLSANGAAAPTWTNTITGNKTFSSGNVTIEGDLITSASAAVIRKATSDGADDRATHLAGGGGASVTRGSYISVYGNESSNPGLINLDAGSVVGDGRIILRTQDLTRLAVEYDGDVAMTGTSAAHLAQIPSGTEPAYAFVGDTNTGIRRSAEGRMSFVLNGAEYLELDTSRATSVASLRVPQASAGNPSLHFTGDEDTGIFGGGSNEIGFSTAGTSRILIQSNGSLLLGNTGNQSTTKAATSPNLRSTNGFNSVFFGHSNSEYNGVLGALSSAGTPFIGGHFYHSSNANELRRSGANTPSMIQFQPSGGMFFYAAAAGTIDSVFTPIEAMNVTTAGEVQFGGGSTGDAWIQRSEGSTGSPAYSFIGDGDTGFDRRGTDEIAIITNGTERVRVLSDGGLQMTAGDTAAGNVPHDCATQTSAVTGSASATVTCPSNKIAMSCGCTQSSNITLFENYITGSDTQCVCRWNSTPTTGQARAMCCSF